MIFEEIETLYNEIDNYYAIKEFNARSIGLEQEEFDAMVQREHNEQAYYLYTFTRLENIIHDLFDTLVKTKIASAIDIKDRNAWQTIKRKRLELMEEVSFFMVAGGRDYNLIYMYKKKRDSIAHGSYAPGINLPAILIDMKSIYGTLLI